MSGKDFQFIGFDLNIFLLGKCCVDTSVALIYLHINVPLTSFPCDL